MVAGRIKRSREDFGWTQEDLGRRAGLSGMAISHYETGRRTPSVWNLIKIADALRVTTDHLLCDERALAAVGALPTEGDET